MPWKETQRDNLGVIPTKHKPNATQRLALWLICALTWGLVGCTSIGPGTVPRDRFDYSSGITESWKRQNLLNIVKLRYLDPPTFVDVGQIVAGYSLETGVNAGGVISSLGAVQGNNFMLGANAKFIDRPTITYTPLTGNKFVRGLMTPIQPESLFSTIQSGWPADALLLAGASSMNGLRNAERSGGTMAPPDPDFLKTLELMRKIQLSGAVGLRVVPGANKQASSVVTFRAKDITEETLADIKELRRLLRLDPDALEFQLVVGTMPANNKELAMITRSMLHIMQTMASEVDVPPADEAEGRTNPGWHPAKGDPARGRMVHIYSAKGSPKDAFVTVPYRGHWFWIDDRDLKSKRTFALMMLLFTLAETGEREPLPVVTIPAQ